MVLFHLIQPVQQFAVVIFVAVECVQLKQRETCKSAQHKQRYLQEVEKTSVTAATIRYRCQNVRRECTGILFAFQTVPGQKNRQIPTSHVAE